MKLFKTFCFFISISSLSFGQSAIISKEILLKNENKLAKIGLIKSANHALKIIKNPIKINNPILQKIFHYQQN